MTSLRRWSDFSNRNDWPLLLLLWLVMTLAMLWGYRDGIAQFRMPDPDDALRLVQVRDLLGGQAWYDLTQYRINPADGGGQLHWSRFIDVQIAGLILLLEPFLPTLEAERWAVTLYPLLLLLPLLFIFRRLLGYLGDRSFVVTGMLLAATCFSFLHYFVPLRVDHHNWQWLLSVAMLWLALGPASFARGLVAGLVIALHVEISLEGLPYLVIFGGLFALDWLRRPETAPRLAGFALGVATLPLVWIGLWRGMDAITGVYCDAFSRPYLAGVLLTGWVLWAGLRFLPRLDDWRMRVGLLAAAAAAGGIAFVLAGPACLAGPFGNLSPLVRTFWYEGISEGRPVWQLAIDIQIAFVTPSLIGLAGVAWATWRHRHSPLGENWFRLLLAALGSVILSFMVLRTTAVTHAYVLPGYVPLVLGIFRWGRSLSSAALRVPATALAVVAAPISVSAAAIGLAMYLVPPTNGDMPTDCITPAATARLAGLPPATIFTPLDISPALLLGTPHSAIASGHHRNHVAMHRVIATFMAPPEQAEAMVRKSGASWLAVCRNMTEYKNFVDKAKGGLSAQLERGTPPPWLELDRNVSVGPLRVYRVRPE